MILIFFAFLSGLVTIAAPCIWPILPIVLSSAATGGHRRPLGITLGVVVSFSIITLSIAYIVSIIPFDPEILRYVSVIIIGFLGVTLIIPQLGGIIEGAVSRLSGKLGPKAGNQSTGFWGGFITGLSLGIVWTPCAGPILATIATLSATKTVNVEIVVVMIAYMAGVAIPLFLFALLGQKIFSKTRVISAYTGQIQKVFGVIMIITAILIATGYDRKLQTALLDAVPSYQNFLLKLETNDGVTEQLDALRGIEKREVVDMPFPEAGGSNLPKLGKAPDFVGITQWLNSEELSMNDLRGKVVLVDFWTYTCINCIRTLPYVTGWYEKYKDDGFVVIGVHAPEFEFEKKTENVKNAIKQYAINYPVAQDNNFQTWRAYDNHYWPAKYLIDANGIIRYTHFGEGEYDVTEENIQKLLEEAGKSLHSKDNLLNIVEKPPSGPQTPETYLGLARMVGFGSNEGAQPGIHQYTLPQVLNTNEFAFQGSWNLNNEEAEVSEKGAGLLMRFVAKDVYLVITPATIDDQIAVFVDDEPVKEFAGEDVKDGFVQIDNERLYHLISLDEKETHLLQLNFQTPGTAIYAFTFGS